MSKGMLEIYRPIWAETQHAETAMLDLTDDGDEVLNYLIFHEGRVMLKAEYEALRLD